ncbi:hypothetical protein MBGDF03_01188 [Thermoplasmatales archaeon SCGC AB-540-F20]|nr:hypothetical protein MBGDF03_01188 [Thermoplasmatales archaeon SCGC AB-540-F20]
MRVEESAYQMKTPLLAKILNKMPLMRYMGKEYE